MLASTRAEAKKMRLVPGSVFADEAGARVPRLAGTGLEVVEIIQVYLASERDMDVLKRAFPWLSPEQLQAALQYYTLFPDEVNASIAENVSCIAGCHNAAVGLRRMA
jgi:uncharacterized protein (DUF433 family)